MQKIVVRSVVVKVPDSDQDQVQLSHVKHPQLCVRMPQRAFEAWVLRKLRDSLTPEAQALEAAE